MSALPVDASGGRELAYMPVNFPQGSPGSAAAPTAAPALPIDPSVQDVLRESTPKVKLGLKARIFKKIDQAEDRLNHLIPGNSVQKAYDELCDIFQSHETEKSREFSEWLQDNGDGPWYEKLATFLAKLPIKVARNIANLVVTFIKLAIAVPTYILMHPMKTFLKLAKIIIELLQPETWTKIGAGMMGSSAATAAVTGGFSAVTFIIGAALAFAGISVGTLKTALAAEKGFRMKAAQDHFFNEAMQFTETFATSFCLVLTFEAIQQIIRGFQKLDNHVKNKSAINQSKRVHIENQSKEFLDSRPDLEPGYELTNRTNHFELRWNQQYHHYTPKVDGAVYHGIDQVHTGNDVSTVWVTYVNDAGHLDIKPVIVVTPIYTPYHLFKVGLDGKWVAPDRVLLGVAPRVDNVVMANLGVSEAARALELQDEKPASEPKETLVSDRSRRRSLRGRFRNESSGDGRRDNSGGIFSTILSGIFLGLFLTPVAARSARR